MIAAWILVGHLVVDLFFSFFIKIQNNNIELELLF